MYEMYEAFPILGGLVTGLIVSQLKGNRLKGIAIALLSITIGFAASTVSGELEMSWGYVILDIAQVLVAAVVVTIAVAYWKSYTGRS